MNFFEQVVEFLQQETLWDLFRLKFLPFLGLHLALFIFYKRVSRNVLKKPQLWIYVFLHASYYSLVIFSICLFTLATFVGQGNWICHFESFSGQIFFKIYLVLFVGLVTEKTRTLLLAGGLLKQQIKKSSVKSVSRLVRFSLLLWFFALVMHFFFPRYKVADNVLFQMLSFYTLLCIVGIIAYVFLATSRYYSALLKKRNHKAGHAFLEATTWPVILLLLGCSGVYILSAFGIADKGYYLVGGISVIFSFFKLVSLGEAHFLSMKKVQEAPNRTLLQGVGNLMRGILSLLLAMLVWSVFTGESISGFGAAIGAAGLGLAFAAKPIAENYLSGLVIYFEGSFRVGDWIYFTDKNVEGTIEHIGARSTAIRTFDKRLLYVPNSLFESMSIVNASKMTHRRILQKIPIGSITDLRTLDHIVQETRLVVYNHPGIDQTQTLMVHFTGFGAQGLEITIYAMTKTKNWHTYLNVQEHILREVKRIIEKHGGAPPSHVSYRLPPSQDSYMGVIEP